MEEEEGMGERDKMLLEQLRDDLQSRLRSKLREKIIQKPHLAFEERCDCRKAVVGSRQMKAGPTLVVPGCQWAE